MGVSVLHASLSQCKHSVAHSCRTQGERSVKRVDILCMPIL